MISENEKLLQEYLKSLTPKQYAAYEFSKKTIR